MRRLCSMYDALKQMVAESCAMAHLTRMAEDLTHDTIIVASCVDSTNMTDDQIIEHFKYKLNEVTFQTSQDLKQNNIIQYADYHKTEGLEE